ncbi:hypothetical protein Ahy_B01g056201 [Arachis hypogaea]|uniref:Uncharacterized protein n=1 Tax=Arachis hypogaea TaxID=3818 RepID=A0A445AYA7_ARAHY|nr:hypothetical protein Ahy_B01g056201 [Arachis hypogaea]
MRLRCGKIIHMADEISIVNGGSSTNDSIPVSMQQADVSSRSEAAIGTERVENGFQNEKNVLNQENPYVIPRGQNADDVLARLRANHGGERYQTELMKKEKEKYRNEQRSKSKPFTRKEKVAYVTMESSEEEFDFETEVDLAELKKGPPYVRPVYPRTGDGLLDFLVQQKIKDRDISLCPRCNTVFDPEAAATFKKERMKKELAHREEQARQSGGHRAPSRNQYSYYRGRTRGKELSKGATPSVHSRIVFPSDGETYPKEIPSPAKMEKGKAIAQSSGIDKNKDVDVDEEYFDEGDDDMVRTISIIPIEYLGEYEGDPNEDYDSEDEEAFSFIRIEDEPGYFLRPTEKQMSHLRLLHITTTLGGIKVNKVLIDGGVAISLLPERMLIKLLENKFGSADEVESHRNEIANELAQIASKYKIGSGTLESLIECGVSAGSSKEEFKRSVKSWLRIGSLTHVVVDDPRV